MNSIKISLISPVFDNDLHKEDRRSTLYVAIFLFFHAINIPTKTFSGFLMLLVANDWFQFCAVQSRITGLRPFLSRLRIWKNGHKFRDSPASHRMISKAISPRTNPAYPSIQNTFIIMILTFISTMPSSTAGCRRSGFLHNILNFVEQSVQTVKNIPANILDDTDDVMGAWI